MKISDSSFFSCKAFLALAKASRLKLLLLAADEFAVPSVLDFPVTSSDLILTPPFSLVVVIEDTFEATGPADGTATAGAELSGC